MDDHLNLDFVLAVFLDFRPSGGLPWGSRAHGWVRQVLLHRVDQVSAPLVASNPLSEPILWSIVHMFRELGFRRTVISGTLPFRRQHRELIFGNALGDSPKLTPKGRVAFSRPPLRRDFWLSPKTLPKINSWCCLRNGKVPEITVRQNPSSLTM